MSREIMIIAKNKDGVISNNIVKIGENGQPIVIKGTKDTFYEIKDMATNRAPDQIYTKRFKNDLKLKINPKGDALDGAGEADVVIQDYCANGNCEIVGVHETGEYYQYVPQSGDAELMTTKMADGEFAYQSLGTVESSSWGPASLLPLAGLGGLGGGGGSKGDTTAPDAPSVTMVTDDYDGQEGSNYWGADVDAGSWSIDSATGDIITNGNINVNSDGKIITNDNTPTLSGTGEAGTTVRVYNGDIDPDDPTVNLVGEAIVDSNGDWTVDIDMSAVKTYSPFYPNGNPGEEITLSITLTDAAGNESVSSEINFVLDTLTSNTPMNISITDGINTVQTATDGENFYVTQPSFTISDDFFSYRTFSNPMGEDESVSYEEGTEIYITLTNRDTLQTYQIGGPDGPSVVVGSDGTWSANVVLVDYGLIDGLYDVEVTIKEPSGDTYGTIGTFGIDTHAPKASDISNSTSINPTDAYVNITLYDVSPIETYIDAFGNEYPQGLTAQKLIIYCDGVEVDSVDLSLEFDGDYSEYSITYTDVGVGDGVHMYQVDTVDVAGNHSGLSSEAWVLVDDNSIHDLTGLYDDQVVIDAKDLTNMQLIGSSASDTFILDSVDFERIDAGTGLDTFTLQNDSGLLNIIQLDGFEVFNIGNNTFDIGSETIESDYASREFILINGDGGTVKLDTAVWTQTHDDYSYNGAVYDVYTNSNGGDPLYIQTAISVA